MATITRVQLDPPRTVDTPTVRISLAGGCDLRDCGCSDEPFLFVSDGTVALSVRLDPSDVQTILALHPFEDEPEVLYD